MITRLPFNRRQTAREQNVHRHVLAPVTLTQWPWHWSWPEDSRDVQAYKMNFVGQGCQKFNQSVNQ